MYEERVTLWYAKSADDAFTQAETEAAYYAAKIVGNGEVLDLFQAYRLPEHEYETAGETLTDETGIVASPKIFLGEPGSELFSLIRDSDLSPDEYIKRFFDTGTEHQGHWSPDDATRSEPPEPGE
jgi:hypothetical protein